MNQIGTLHRTSARDMQTTILTIYIGTAIKIQSRNLRLFLTRGKGVGDFYSTMLDVSLTDLVSWVWNTSKQVKSDVTSDKQLRYIYKCVLK